MISQPYFKLIFYYVTAFLNILNSWLTSINSMTIWSYESREAGVMWSWSHDCNLGTWQLARIYSCWVAASCGHIITICNLFCPFSPKKTCPLGMLDSLSDYVIHLTSTVISLITTMICLTTVVKIIVKLGTTQPTTTTNCSRNSGPNCVHKLRITGLPVFLWEWSPLPCPPWYIKQLLLQ